MCLAMMAVRIASTSATSSSSTTTTTAITVSLANTCANCLYSFTAPQFPSFTLPAAQPNSPGDQQLNLNNNIRLSNGSALNAGQGCNGGRSSGEYAYLNESNGQWMTSYPDVNGRPADLNVFYATAQSALNVATLQTNYANLALFLTCKTIRLNITCNNGQKGCIYFTVNCTAKQGNTSVCSMGSSSTSATVTSSSM
ncbi:unnamed protein product [Didymodactylos carnosus]|uniref:Uncharacterized protein n=1 Tax=Didymodactylos carnosus TaxID=1234261 RepID=A0A8S2E7K8_9BILA|nr:unnamed protein product [Didymodactylos carnosus]CAF3859672.1 unnamed protein product [Didymodactylos carnosus]